MWLSDKVMKRLKEWEEWTVHMDFDKGRSVSGKLEMMECDTAILKEGRARHVVDLAKVVQIRFVEPRKMGDTVDAGVETR